MLSGKRTGIYGKFLIDKLISVKEGEKASPNLYPTKTPIETRGIIRRQPESSIIIIEIDKVLEIHATTAAAPTIENPLRYYSSTSKY